MPKAGPKRNLRTWVTVTKDTSQHSTTRVRINTSIEAARILMTILGKIGGNPDGPRGAISAVWRALDDAHIAPYSVRDVFEDYVNPENDGPIRIAHMTREWPVEKVRV